VLVPRDIRGANLPNSHSNELNSMSSRDELCRSKQGLKVPWMAYKSRMVILWSLLSSATAQSHVFHYDTRTYSFSARIFNIWYSLPNSVVDVDTVCLFKPCLDKF